ncbi:endo alpha-1,4 polygalactosaminidase [Crossiella sp. CA198]|uniref:endo alpha-1,4 polygalactosaminidase n=1 Tax=Crossiella sp. CA198 TaxID=3455607 RepID=UPI003F8CF6BE
MRPTTGLLALSLAALLAVSGCTHGNAAEDEATSSPSAVEATSTEPPPSSTGTPAPPPSEPGSTPPPPPPASKQPAAKDRWRPAPGVTWQWQLTVPVDTSVKADVYDIDAMENSREVVQALQAKGSKVICYVNAGASEDYRADAGRLRSATGKENGWPGERWLDVRKLDVLLPVMADRFQVCRDKGFDGIEADLVDAYTHDTGHSISVEDQLTYNRALAKLAHGKGLSIGLKNALGLIPQLVAEFDFAVNEQCAEYDECDKLSPFIKAGKAVLHAEYDLDNAKFCPTTRRLNLSSIRKNLKLDAPRWPC